MFTETTLIGLFIGLLCGLVPLIFGILKKTTIWAIVGISITTISGGVFAIFGKSPFNAIVIGMLFILFIVAEQNRKAKHAEEHEEHEDYDDTYHAWKLV